MKNTAIDTFKRAMRRHERRAHHAHWLWLSRAWASDVANEIRSVRLDVCAGDLSCDDAIRRLSAIRGETPVDGGQTLRFAIDRAADAVARLKEGLRREEDADAPPYVCPGCHRVNAACAPGCIDAEMERDREEREYGGAEDDDDYAVECMECASTQFPCDCEDL